ncbi:hypothetical protein VFC2021_03490 [Listeria innocua]
MCNNSFTFISKYEKIACWQNCHTWFIHTIPRKKTRRKNNENENFDGECNYRRTVCSARDDCRTNWVYGITI